jgi:cytoskeletal protein RodZ
MTSFIAKDIAAHPSVGQRLAARRAELDKTVMELARECNIQSRYLLALEEGEYRQLPGDVYAKSFLKVYAQALGLPADEVVRQYSSERIIYHKTQYQTVDTFDKPVTKISWQQLLATPKLLRVGVLLSVGLLVTGYLGVKVTGIVSPPRLHLATPEKDIVTADTMIEVAGVTDEGAQLSINGEPVVADQEGKFTRKLDLQRGLNTVEITAKKKHSQSAVVTRQVVVVASVDQDAPEPTAALPTTPTSSTSTSAVSPAASSTNP